MTMPARSDSLPTADGESVPTTQIASLLALPVDAIATASVSHLGRFRIERLLDRGGSSLVYLGWDERLERRVAIKLLQARSAGADRLLREAQLLALLNHPAIATVYTLEKTDDGVTMLITEYVRGETLAARLKSARLTMDRSLRLCAEIASAIEVAHQQGVVHCDIKPSNIMLTDADAVKVLDFGLARLLSTVGRVGGGTPGYASPEQAAGLTVGPSTDVFGLGCVIFECLAGEPAFDPSLGLEATSGELAWSRLPAETPSRVVEMLKRSLARSPADRRISAGEVRIVLEQASRNVPESVPAAARGNLPVQFTRFIGREADMARLRELVMTHRVVTLVGTGGCGKSRLATAVAQDLQSYFDGGAWYAELATCTDEAEAVAAIAQVLGVREQPGQSLLGLISACIGSRPLLLILDNCEHLVGVCADIVTRLLACTRLHLLATSREPLNMYVERKYNVPALSLPRRDGRSGPESDAVRLFFDRAQLVRPQLALEAHRPHIEAICETLDGIPLAIELAAARLRHTTAEELATAVSNRYRTLTGGNRAALPHHQTLRGLIDWSYSLLTEAERALFRRLSIFSGGWTFRAVQRVQSTGGGEPEERGGAESSSSADLLVGLANKSLLILEEHGGEPRFRMLETLRQYAAERLAESESVEAITAWRRAHALHYRDFADAENQKLTGADQQQALRRLQDEHDNLRAALRWLAGPEGDAADLLRLAVSLAQFWYMRGFITEGRTWLTTAIAAAPGAPLESRAQAANCLGILAWLHGDPAEAARSYEQSAELWERLGNRSKLAAVMSNLAGAAADLGDLAKARSSHLRSIEAYEWLGDRIGVARAQLNFSVLLNQEGEHAEAQTRIDACLPVFEQERDDHRIAAAIHNRGHAMFGQGCYPEAAECFTRSLANREVLDDRLGIALDELWLGLCDAHRGEPMRAVERLAKAESIRVQAGAKLSNVDQRELDAVIIELKRGLGAERFQSLWDHARG